jgi:cytidylate kinase
MAFVVAVDGPSGVGKGTLAKRIARHYGWDFLDTGALYRAVGLAALAGGVDLGDSERLAALAHGIDPALLDDPALRDEEVGQAASLVAADPAVRQALLDFQQRFAQSPPNGVGAVIDGRDIGTVICPQAQVKLFLSASQKTRALRRAGQLGLAGDAAELARITRDMEARDVRDAGRAAAPLKAAPDAHLLDTTNLDIDSTFRAALAIIEDHPAFLKGTAPRSQ